MNIKFRLLNEEELAKVNDNLKITNPNVKGIFNDNQLIGIINTQNFRNEAASVDFKLLAEYDNQETTNMVLNTLIDSYDYPDKKDFISIVGSHDSEKINKLTNAGWDYDVNLAEQVNAELGGSYIVFTCKNPNYGKTIDNVNKSL